MSRAISSMCHLQNSINQFYYRTQALAEFMNEIKVKDCKAL